ncbi:Heterocyst differentiation ATP-binding protein HepA [Fundidesulfovibrio magnetotacticus]|uniref:Heterocyst differentiation ATP-binding protein HepA n=1 Tax=Fundidesulfovibrio magnetotacticus TaxID=2730080 RepID=A0A6V8LQQ1_9BACT|nr:ABC transporter ATP-binding protein [Fundidesulfovibrio magnetotacticus]GFK94823.1 Heterocyst differentiation ATP-binding protein HepA [Fundidesulfovibrio magnetotacticus]
MKNIPILSTLTHYYGVFRRHVGNRLIVLFALILAGGLTEGLGFTLFIPLLGVEGGAAADNTPTRFVRAAFACLGIELSLAPLLILLVGTFLLKGGFVLAQAVFKARLQTNLERDLRLRFLDRYAFMSYRFYASTNQGHLNNIITTEIGRALSGLNNYVNLIINLVYISIYVGLSMTINAPLTLGVVAACLVAALFLKRVTRLLEKVSRDVSRTNSEVQSLLIQFISQFKYLKATGSFPALLRHLHARIEENRRHSLRSAVLPEFTASAVEPLAVLCLAGLLWYYVGYQGKAMGEVLVVLVFFHRAFMRIFESQNVWQRFSAYIGGITVVDESARALDANREVGGAAQAHALEREIALRGVSFAYGDKPVLQDVTLSIPRNASIGIVGPSGAGKTTLFDLLTGLLAPDKGSVTLDGADYRDIDPVSLRRLFGYVTQDPVAFNDTIADNIAFWACEPGDSSCMERVREAARKAHCLDFIEQAEHGFDTFLGDRGIRLSGGQRQRLSIAREIFKNPSIMIFDEATSALDSEAEAVVQASIREMAGTMTTVIIAHRLSSVRSCDRIYVLDAGRVVEEGSFEQLRDIPGGRFAQMCEAQGL